MTNPMVRTMRPCFAASALIALVLTGNARGLTSLTIYNQDFAVIRDDITLNLKQGTNEVNVNNITQQLEPGSVILRDPKGKWPFNILEQSYRADPVSEQLLLHLFEGKTLEFLTTSDGGEERVIKGKVIRSGYRPLMGSYQGNSSPQQPIIEVEGNLRFSLPGRPLFPPLNSNNMLKPVLAWQINSEKTGAVDAELSYISSGLSWKADYNIILREDIDLADMIGRVTIENHSGHSFYNSQIKLMAGEINKIQRRARPRTTMDMAVGSKATPTVTGKTFDEYHLYTLQRLTTLKNQQTKQVEFIRSNKIKSGKKYIYEGSRHDPDNYRNPERIRDDEDYGTRSNNNVRIIRQFKNTGDNGLGISLPGGRIRFYRQDDDNQLQFIGEDNVKHTASGELVNLYVGNSFDLNGSRKRTSYQINRKEKWLRETFEIQLRNHKKGKATITVVEHLYRWINGKLEYTNAKWKQTDSQTIETDITLKPDEEKTVTYTVHYNWQ